MPDPREIHPGHIFLFGIGIGIGAGIGYAATVILIGFAAAFIGHL